MFEAVALKFVHYILALSSFIGQWLFKIPSLSFLKNNTLVPSDARNFQKLPLHIALIYQETDLCYDDIANVILWCVSMGISYITLYDLHGVIKRNEKLLYDTILRRRQSWTDAEKMKSNIHLHSKLPPRNSCTNSSTVDIFLVALEDGRNSLVKAAKTLSQKVCEKHFKPADINPIIVDQLLQEEYKYPDPDLIIRFGSVESLLGFMPWQVRLTEILSLPTHRGLDYKTFKSVLISYGNTQQRFGK